MPQARHRHVPIPFADPDEASDLARVDLRCPVPGCPVVASEFVDQANKRDCRKCGQPIEEWRSHMPRLCKRCECAKQKIYNHRARAACKRSEGPVFGLRWNPPDSWDRSFTPSPCGDVLPRLGDPLQEGSA